MWRKMNGVDSRYKAILFTKHNVELGLYMNQVEEAHIYVEHQRDGKEDQ